MIACISCQKFFLKFSCNKTLGECDCPKCQGYCQCQSSVAWVDGALAEKNASITTCQAKLLLKGFAESWKNRS